MNVPLRLHRVDAPGVRGPLDAAGAGQVEEVSP